VELRTLAPDPVVWPPKVLRDGDDMSFSLHGFACSGCPLAGRAGSERL